VIVELLDHNRLFSSHLTVNFSIQFLQLQPFMTMSRYCRISFTDVTNMCYKDPIHQGVYSH